MSYLKQTTTFKVIEAAENFVDVNAEVVAITGFDSQSGNVLNICFMRSFVTTLADEDGQPASAEVGLRKVASVTMSVSRARALHSALGKALEAAPEEDEK